MLISINGKLFDERDAKISIFDRGFLYGDGIFETIPVAAWKAFWLSEHLDRLFDGCSKMLIDLPWTKEEVTTFCETVVEKNHAHPYEKIKIILSRGSSWYSANIEDLKQCLPNLVVYCIENKLPSGDEINNGLKIMTTKQIRPYPEIKSTSYIASILWNIYAKEKGFDDILFVDAERNILEWSGFNFFVVKDWVFRTPDSDVLDGITAQKTIEAIKKLWYTVERWTINFADIANVSEAFITSTTKKIVPVMSIDDVTIGDGGMWTKTRAVIEKFTEMYF